LEVPVLQAKPTGAALEAVVEKRKAVELIAIGIGGQPEMLMIGLSLMTSDTATAPVGFGFAFGRPPNDAQLPTAMIAVMGPEAAVNAVYYNKLQAMPEAQRELETEKLRDEYRADIDIERLASELVIDAIVAPERLRDELAARFRAIADRPHDPAPPKRRSVTPM